jgi:hypothetical protein
MYDFNTVDFQQTLTYTMIVEFQQCQGPMQEILYAFIVNNLDTVWHLGDISEIKRSRYFVAIPHLINK